VLNFRVRCAQGVEHVDACAARRQASRRSGGGLTHSEFSVGHPDVWRDCQAQLAHGQPVGEGRQLLLAAEGVAVDGEDPELVD